MSGALAPEIIDILHSTPTIKHALKVIRDLYDTKRDIRGQSLEQLQTLSKKSPTAQAIRYALNQWTALTRFLDDGRSEADNYTAERSLRTVTLGRKNHLFLDSGGERAATL